MTEQRELTSGDTLELEIGDVAHGGIFVARHESGRVVFVADALPGERARVRITEVKKRFARAETLEVIDVSEHRHDHIWREASLEREPENRAGGAEFGHMLPEYGRELKRRVLADALSRFGGFDAADPLVAETQVVGLPGDDETRGTGWRTRLTLHVDDQGKIGPYASRSHNIVPVNSLPLAYADIEELAIEQIRKGSHRGPGRIDFVAPSDHDVRMRPVLDTLTPRDPQLIRECVHGHDFVVAEDGFWQVHRHAATTLFDAVRAAVDIEKFDPEAGNLDLYGGVGLFGVALADLGGPDTSVVSVEATQTATDLASQNLGRWQYGGAVTGRVDRYLQTLVSDADEYEREAIRHGTVVLDPPRAGAGKQALDPLTALEPAQLVYVACDPVAFARDAGLLRERGYALTRMRAFDLFPNTHHVEVVASFARQ